MEKRVALYGFLVVLAVCWNASVCNAEPRKLPRLKRTFVRRRIANIAVSTGWRAPRCGTAWTATHTSASKHSSRRARSLETRWRIGGVTA